MTDATPLPDEQLDELLSAELDGEFEAAARDLGFSPDEARARVDATPDAGARRDALAATRGVLAVPPLPDDVRDRLVASAVAAAMPDELAARRTRSRSRLVAYTGGAVAAALLLVVGAVALFSNSHNDDRTTVAESSGAAASATTLAGDAAAPAARDAAPYSFGAIDSPAQLHDEVKKQLDVTEHKSAQQLAGGGAQPGTDDIITSVPAPVRADSENDASSPQALAACAATQADAFAVTSGPLLSGPVTYAGVAAEIYVYAQPDNYLVVVAAQSDCSLLVSQFIDREP
jgi:hypothetical protein